MDQATQLAVQAIKNRLDQLTEAEQVDALHAVLDSMPYPVIMDWLSNERYTIDDWKMLSAAQDLVDMIKVQANG